MSAPPRDTLWPAEEHTLAKIAILRAYLQAWFTILGTTVPKDMLYIDGFAGPGSYCGGEDGSPIVAVKVANDALAKAGAQWKAKTIRMIFVECDKPRFDILESRLAPIKRQPNLKIRCVHGEFASTFNEIKGQHQDAFNSSAPLFAFLDPFGVKGVTFQNMQEVLSSGTSEAFVLMHAAGMERIRKAGENADNERILDEVFGGSEWRKISFTNDTKLNSRKILAAYRQRLREAAGAKFTFSFEMRKSNGTVSHHLLFATKHIKGLEKMKEAMRSVDKNFVFTDGQSNQQFLFAPDDPAVIARDAENYFKERWSGREISYDELKAWILQETPYMGAEKILNVIKDRRGVDSVTVGGTVVKPISKMRGWSGVEKIKFREKLATPEAGLFG